LRRTIAAIDDAAQRLSQSFLTQLALNAAFGVIREVSFSRSPANVLKAVTTANRNGKTAPAAAPRHSSVPSADREFTGRRR
jgi:hypothetical protein